MRVLPKKESLTGKLSQNWAYKQCKYLRVNTSNLILILMKFLILLFMGNINESSEAHVVLTLGFSDFSFLIVFLTMRDFF